jgi:hypothetical protein
MKALFSTYVLIICTTYILYMYNVEYYINVCTYMQPLYSWSGCGPVVNNTLSGKQKFWCSIVRALHLHRCSNFIQLNPSRTELRVKWNQFKIIFENQKPINAKMKGKELKMKESAVIFVVCIHVITIYAMFLWDEMLLSQAEKNYSLPSTYCVQKHLCISGQKDIRK